MSILLLTDTPARAQRLAQSLSAFGPSLILDLLDPDQAKQRPDPASLRIVISDVSFTSSSVVAGLRAQIDHLRSQQPPYLCLLHEDTPRAHAQASALGATRIVRADQVSRGLLDAVEPLFSQNADPPNPLADGIAMADRTLTRIFDVGRRTGTVDPELIASGAAAIDAALRETDMQTWLNIVWRFDDATHQHCLLVAGLAAVFGGQLGLRNVDRQRLTEAALLHDVGKARIPTAILNKPGPLDEAERAIMQTHPVLGYEMVLGGGYHPDLLAVVRSHHELLDGSGYPDGLHGNAIPDLVRLVTICDVFGALIERRPYRVPISAIGAYDILDRMGDKLDVILLKAFQPIAMASDLKV